MTERRERTPRERTPTGAPTRLGRCRRILESLGLDGVIVTALPDVRYLSGFRGEDAALVVGRRVALLVTDSRFFAQVREEVREFELVESDGVDLAADAAAAADEALGGGGAVGYQGAAVSHADYRTVRRLHHGPLRDVRQAVSHLRMVKEPGEIAAIARAASIVDEALAVVVGEGLVGRSERQVAWRLLEEYHDRGAEGESFPAIVAAGDHAAQGHAIPGERRIKPGDLVVIDTGARVDGYCSDVTRTFAAGRATTSHRGLHDVVLAALEAGVGAVRPGAHGRDDVDAAARAVIAAAGHGEHFGHGVGHGVGLEIHEAPWLEQKIGDRLAAGMVCTIEPGIYIEGEVGLRIEDTVLVTEDGCELLTHYPRSLQIVA